MASALTTAALKQIEATLPAAQAAGLATNLIEMQNAIPSTALGTAAASAALAPTTSGEYRMAIANASETNTLAAPAFAGQIVSFGVDSRAGSGTRAITASAAVNATGNTVLTFNATTDTCTLLAVTVAGTVAWRVLYNDGVTLS